QTNRLTAIPRTPSLARFRQISPTWPLDFSRISNSLAMKGQQMQDSRCRDCPAPPFFKNALIVLLLTLEPVATEESLSSIHQALRCLDSAQYPLDFESEE